MSDDIPELERLQLQVRYVLDILAVDHALHGHPLSERAFTACKNLHLTLPPTPTDPWLQEPA